MEKIDTIIKALRVICDANFSTMENPNSDMILDCAVRLYITDKINASKTNGGATGTTERATDKQITAMENMNIAHRAETTKEEAKNLISEKIATFS